MFSYYSDDDSERGKKQKALREEAVIFLKAVCSGDIQTLEKSKIDSTRILGFCHKVPMHYAAEYDQPEVIEYLCNKGHNVDQSTIRSPAPLPPYHGFIEVGEWRKSDDKPDLLPYGGGDNKTPAHFAAAEGSLRALQKLQEFGADIYQNPFDMGFTHESPICYAIKYDQRNILEWYLNKGVRDMMHIAARCAKLSVMEWLEHEKNIDCTTVDKFGNTTIHSLLLGNHWHQKEELLKIIEWLAEQGVDINEPNNEGITALHLIAQKYSLELAEWFIKRVADINAKDKKGETPMDIAIKQGNLELMQLLKDNGAAVKANSFYLRSDAKIYEWLEDNGANNVNIPGRDGLTPLHVAVKEYNFEAVKWLLNKGADCNIKDSHGQTAIEMAITQPAYESPYWPCYSTTFLISALLSRCHKQLKFVHSGILDCLSNNIERIIDIEVDIGGYKYRTMQGIFDILNVVSNWEGEKAAKLSSNLLSILEKKIQAVMLYNDYCYRSESFKTYEELKKYKVKMENLEEMLGEIKSLLTLFSWPNKKEELKNGNKFIAQFNKIIIESRTLLEKYKEDLGKYAYELLLSQTNEEVSKNEKSSPDLVDLGAQGEDMPPTKMLKTSHETSLMGE